MPSLTLLLCPFLTRTTRSILEAITPEDNSTLEDEDFGDSVETASIIITGSSDQPSSSPPSQPNYEQYRRRLTPLMELEQRLIQVLSDPEDDGEREATHLPDNYGSYAAASSSSPSSSSSPHRPPRIMIPPASASYPSAHSAGLTSPRSPTSPTTSIVSSTHELAIRTGLNWKKHFALGKIQSPKSADSGGELMGWWEDPDDPVHTLNRCAPVMNELWRDPKVRATLHEKRIRLEESSGL